MRIHEMWKTGLLALLAVACLLFLFIKPPASSVRADFAPPARELSVTSEVTNADRAIEYYRSRIRNRSDAVDNYVALAHLYQQKARFTARHHAFVGLAQEMLDEALRRDPDNYNALLQQASIWLTLHQFERAKTLAQALTKRDSYKSDAWGVYSDALKELGEYKAAISACDRMLGVRPDLRSYARAAHLRELHGDLRGAKQAMRMAVKAGVVGSESHAWASTQLGNLYMTTGDLDTAEVLFESVLAARTDYPRARAGLGKVDAARGNFEAAEQRLLNAYRLAPEHEFMEELVGLYKKQGETGKAAALAESVLQDYRDHETKGWNVNLEYSKFCLDAGVNLEQALTRMELEYERRPNHVEVLETLAWALHKNGQSREAVPHIEAVLKMNPANNATKLRHGAIMKTCDGSSGLPGLGV